MELRDEQNTVRPDFRVIIAGGRDFNDYPLLKAKCDKILASKSQTHNIVVITGAARGADSLGEQYARERVIPSIADLPTGTLKVNQLASSGMSRWRTVPMP